ncbi:MAG TPA: VWA domain-containing protein [Pyrinomonadaceae bacterium]|jgi:VWFA-related protein
MKKPASQALNLALVFCLIHAAPLVGIAQQQRRPATPTPTPAPASTQTPEQQPAPDDDREDDVVRITSNLVQLDVVVLDKEGRQVTDLQAEDFEILEDGKPQPITNFSYVALNVASTPTTAAPVDKNAPRVPPRTLRPEQVQRTMALVVDDLGLSFESIPAVRRTLKKFVDEQMQPNDLVAIVRTRAGMGALQQFTSDKRLLHAGIEKIRWYPQGRGGISAFAPIETQPVTRDGDERRGPGASARERDDRAGDRDAELEQNEFREEVFSVGTLGALNYIVRGLRELPGRKSVMMFSEGFSLNRTDGQSQRLLDALRRLTDMANRASVVVYTIDPRGLMFTGMTAADNTANVSAEQLERELSARGQKLIDTQQGLEYLSRQTGGFTVRDTNDLTRGVRRVLDDQKGFYLIGYRPDAATFDPVRGRARFHNVTAKVKRAGLRVRTRNGFYGFTDEEVRKPTRGTRREQIVRALVSPFATGGVQLRLTSLFGNAENVSFVTSLLHINSQHISLREDADGWRRAVVDLVALTFGENGAIVDQVDRTETIRLRGQAYERFLRHGLVYVMKVPVKKPGAYQLRVAVRDEASQRVGSASQFIEIPDLKKNRLALSSIIITNSQAQMSANASNNQGATASQTTTAQEQNTFGADAQSSDRPDASFDASLRRFRRGASVDYFYHIYNARLDKATGRPQLQTQMRLFRDGQQIVAGKEMPFDAGKQTDLKRLAAGSRIRLGRDLAPGEYVLQVVVTDLLAPEKRRTATQWIDFEIVE